MAATFGQFPAIFRFSAALLRLCTAHKQYFFFAIFWNTFLLFSLTKETVYGAKKIICLWRLIRRKSLKSLRNFYSSPGKCFSNSNLIGVTNLHFPCQCTVFCVQCVLYNAYIWVRFLVLAETNPVTHKKHTECYIMLKISICHNIKSVVSYFKHFNKTLKQLR